MEAEIEVERQLYKEEELYGEYVSTLAWLEVEREADMPDLDRISSLTLKAEACRTELEVELRKLRLMHVDEAEDLKGRLKDVLGKVCSSSAQTASENIVQSNIDNRDSHPKIAERARSGALESAFGETLTALDTIEAELLEPLIAQCKRADALSRSLGDAHVAAVVGGLKEAIRIGE